MLKNISLVCLVLLVSISGSSQTIQQYTMYNLNHFLVNPAAAGNENYLDIRAGYRKQWSGLKDAPKSIYFSGHTILNKPPNYETSALRIGIPYSKRVKPARLKHALGGMINSNQFGAFDQLNANLAYALHLPINRNITLSMGLSAGVKSTGFSQRKANVLYPNDPVYNDYASSDRINKLDVNSGVYIYSDKFYAGYSVQQILRNKVGFSSAVDSRESIFQIHHALMGGYHFDITNDVRLSPGVLLKAVSTNPISYDLNTIITYKQLVSVGLAYRGEESIGVMCSFQATSLLKIGYSYDFITSDVRNVAGGSNELFIGLTIF